MFHDSDKMKKTGMRRSRLCSVSYIGAKEMAMWLVLKPFQFVHMPPGNPMPLL